MGCAARTARRSGGWAAVRVATICALILVLPEAAEAKGAAARPRVVAKPQAVAKTPVKRSQQAPARQRVAGKKKTARPQVRRAAPPRARGASRRSQVVRKAAPAREHPAARREVPDLSSAPPVLGTAVSMLGVPYRFGGSSRNGIDCSGLTRAAFSAVGVDLPHSARAQFTIGDRVAADELQPGDLVFFRTYRRGASHVGIYIGDEKFIHAARRAGRVRIDRLSNRYFRQRYLGARRLVDWPSPGFGTARWTPGVSCMGAVSCIPPLPGSLPQTGLRYVGI